MERSRPSHCQRARFASRCRRERVVFDGSSRSKLAFHTSLYSIWKLWSRLLPPTAPTVLTVSAFSVMNVGESVTPTDQVFLILYGTGFRLVTSLDNVSCVIGRVPAQVFYAGAQNGFKGLDQMNVRIPTSLRGRGEVDVTLVVDG